MAALNRRVDIDVTALSLATIGLSTVEVGREWLALMRGEESAFQHCVKRERVYASKRLPAPNWGSTRRRIFDRDTTACRSCNRSKRDLMPEEWLA